MARLPVGRAGLKEGSSEVGAESPSSFLPQGAGPSSWSPLAEVGVGGVGAWRVRSEGRGGAGARRGDVWGEWVGRGWGAGAGGGRGGPWGLSK